VSVVVPIPNRRRLPVTSIDVMIPVFNGEATIVEAIESVRDGAHREVTIVVVDDGSTDRTGELVGALAAAGAALPLRGSATSARRTEASPRRASAPSS
jgi:GT2 family glycosyltransferase